MSLLAVVLLGGGVLGVLSALVVHFKDAGFFDKKHARVSAQDDDEDGTEDGDDEDDEDEEEDNDDDGGDDDEQDGNGGDARDGDVETGAAPPPRPKSMKAFVALGDQIHSVVLPLENIESWASLSQTIHETCEDNDVPQLPVHGIMHIVLNVNGKTVPVTGMTPLEELWKAKAIKVSITDDDRDAQKPSRKKSKKKSTKR